MGIGGISIWQLLIILAIVLVLFGTKRLKNIGSDLGGAVKGFKKAVTDEEKKAEQQKLEKADEKVIEGQAVVDNDKGKPVENTVERVVGSQTVTEHDKDKPKDRP